jgi:hypothetical protein
MSSSQVELDIGERGCWLDIGERGCWLDIGERGWDVG